RPAVAWRWWPDTDGAGRCGGRRRRARGPLAVGGWLVRRARGWRSVAGRARGLPAPRQRPAGRGGRCARGAGGLAAGIDRDPVTRVAPALVSRLTAQRARWLARPP